MTTPQELPSQQLDNDEIDLRQVAAALGRHLRLIGGITATAALISGIYAITRKPVWEGQFQIVLENQNASGGGGLALLAEANPLIAGLAGVSGGESSLETEIKILESPSVLKPVYDFVKANKAAAGNDVSKWYYSNWIKNLNIELVKGTTVLSLVYQDTDKSLILPVLKRITNTYQTYSGKDRRRGLNQGVDYLDQEIEKLRQQSATSMHAAQAYALANGLGIQDGMPASSSASGVTSRSVEANREAAQNEVNALRQRIAAAQASGNTTLYKAPQLEANSNVYSQLQQLETRLQQKSALLTPQDQSIQRLQRERSGLIAYINQQTIGLLQGELITAEAQLASLSRPREVVLKHRELVREALRDEKTLAELEVQLQSLKLDKARQTDPWELISTPTVLDSPVAPHKKRMVALGFLGGLVLGCGAALIQDRRSGLIFSEDEINASLPGPLLERISIQNQNSWEHVPELLAKGPLEGQGSVALVPVGSPSQEGVNALGQSLRNALSNRDFLISNDLLKTRDFSHQILLVQVGAVTRKQLAQIRQSLALQGAPVAGWLMIDPTTAST